VSAWSWPRPDTTPVIVTVAGANGTTVHGVCHLQPGRDHAHTIELPPDARTVTIERPLRQRVELALHRLHRRTHRPAPARSWRDDSSLIMYWRAWTAGRSARRALRSRQR
jgi:hypothetical protein